ncbi:MAG: hypothetical protein OEV00_12385 [Acidobacteriota bacterium]|nr:hypothetical protein [Acidobacteriota bacterium]MDH3786109.1 hypothetical protein [Acidobacteriota bacterium]
MRFEFSSAARWLPRVLGATAIVAAWLISLRFTHRGIAFAGGLTLQHMVTALGLFLGWWIVRQGAELRQSVTVMDDGIVWEFERHRRELSWESIERLRFEGPFSRERRWIPAIALEDEAGRNHRVPTFISDGVGLLQELERRSGRDDLAAWIDAHGLLGRMATGRRQLLGAYVMTPVILAVALLLGRA